MTCVVVIGASRGIGLELVRQYAADGARVHATTRTPEAPGALDAVTGDVALHGLDVTDAAAAKRFAGALRGERIDILVHNAGSYGRDMNRAALLAVNVEAPIRTAELLLPRLAGEPPGKLVLMTSQMGSRAGGGRLAAYGESKALLNDRFRERAASWREQGVIAVVMHPGWVRTDMGGAGAPLSVAESVTPMRATIARLRAHDHGRFLTWDGREHPW